VNERIIIVRYGELALKKRETRRRFESTLKKNIASAFASQHIDCKIETIWGRLFVHTTDVSKGLDILQRIFGITSVSPALTSSADLIELSKDCITYLEGRIRNTDSFALRVTRTGTHDYTSQDAARIVGESIRKHFSCSVDLSKPDVELFIEIREQRAYIYLEKYVGPGGMPLGTQGIICAFASCEDDVLAAWFLMRRGCSLVFLITDSSVDRILSLLVDSWFAPSPIYYMGQEKDVLKRLQEIVCSHQCDALCFGGSFSKENMMVLKRIQEMKDSMGLPVLTPLIAMTFHDIEQKKKQFWLKP
jgi:thiamine biosynthesis protein ThiI